MNAHILPVAIWMVIGLIVVVITVVIALRVGDSANRKRGVTTASMTDQAVRDRRPGVPEDLR